MVNIELKELLDSLTFDSEEDKEYLINRYKDSIKVWDDSFINYELNEDYKYKEIKINSLFLELLKDNEKAFKLFSWWYEDYLKSQGWECYEIVKDRTLSEIRRFRRKK
jgi:hypothetical protein